MSYEVEASIEKNPGTGSGNGTFRLHLRGRARVRFDRDGEFPHSSPVEMRIERLSARGESDADLFHLTYDSRQDVDLVRTGKPPFPVSLFRGRPIKGRIWRWGDSRFPNLPDEHAAGIFCPVWDLPKVPYQEDYSKPWAREGIRNLVPPEKYPSVFRPPFLDQDLLWSTHPMRIDPERILEARLVCVQEGWTGSGRMRFDLRRGLLVSLELRMASAGPEPVYRATITRRLMPPE